MIAIEEVGATDADTHMTQRPKWIPELRQNKDEDRRKTGQPTTVRRTLLTNHRRSCKNETQGQLTIKPGQENQERDFKTGGQQSRVDKSPKGNSGP